MNNTLTLSNLILCIDYIVWIRRSIIKNRFPTKMVSSWGKIKSKFQKGKMSFSWRRIKSEDLLKSFSFIPLFSHLKREGVKLKILSLVSGCQKKTEKKLIFRWGRQKSWQKFWGLDREREIARSIYNEGGFSKRLGRESFESEAAAAFKWEEIQFRAFAIRRGSRRLIRKTKILSPLSQISVFFAAFLFFR